MRNEGSFSGSTFFTQDESFPNLFANLTQMFENTDSYVLIFSREKDTRILLSNMLAMWGFASRTTGDLENLLTIINTDPPAIILVDSVLPFDTNLKNIHLIRKNHLTKDVPIALLSGFSQIDCRRRSLDAGANDFFVKPLNFDLLENFLHENF